LSFDPHYWLEEEMPDSVYGWSSLCFSPQKISEFENVLLVRVEIESLGQDYPEGPRL